MQEPELREIIWQLVAAIPRGCVTSYGELAAQSGYPNHARFVGTVLKQLPSDSALPWHRVINARGEISFPQNSEQWHEQRARLASEGVVFNDKNRVRLSDYCAFKTGPT